MNLTEAGFPKAQTQIGLGTQERLLRRGSSVYNSELSAQKPFQECSFTLTEH